MLPRTLACILALALPACSGTQPAPDAAPDAPPADALADARPTDSAPDVPQDTAAPEEPFDGGPLETPVPAPTNDGGAPLPAYNQAYRVATHNSYWVHRTDAPDLFASGTQQRLLDELLFEHARGLEIDVHRAPEARHFEVYHTNRGANSQCATLEDCVRVLREFHRALPQHEVVTVVVELKEGELENFDDAHTPEDLDRPFRELLTDGATSWLYTPRDLLARCAPDATLRDCVRAQGWPRVDELRGRFIVTVLGNWRQDLTRTICLGTHPPEQCPVRDTDVVVGHGPLGWVTYATWQTGARDRVGFPHRSNFVRFNEGVDTETVAPALVDAANAASVFLQVEDLADPSVPGFLADNGVVRGADSFALADQQRRLAAGFQLLQTDHPWLQVDDRGPAQPLRALPFDNASAPIVEPGERLVLRGPADVTREAVAYAVSDPGGCVQWETVPATTRPATDARFPNAARGRGVTCLRASADATDVSADSYSLCRQTQPDERVAVFTRVVRAGVSTDTTVDTADGIADVLALRVCEGTTVSATIRGSALDTPRAITPAAGEVFDRALLHQGLATTRDALFVRTRRNDQPVRASALRVVVPAVPMRPARTDALLLDLGAP